MILKEDADAHFIIRNGPSEPPEGWVKAHPEEMFVGEDGERMPHASMASDLYWDNAAKACAATVQFCEAQPFSDRILGYWFGMPGEGTYVPAITGRLYDHSPRMTERWRAFLKEKYKTVEALRQAHANNALTFETVEVPRDKLLGPQADVSRLLYWQDAKANQPLRDYLELVRQLTHNGYRKLMTAMRGATDRKRFFVYDGFKQSMQGWNLQGFFDTKQSWLTAWPEVMAASGHTGVAELFSATGFDGVVTPHDYQARGIGGVYEPEGIVD